MSIADRDGYQDDLRAHERWHHPLQAPFRRHGPPERSLSVATWIVIIGAVAASSYAASRWSAPQTRPVTPKVAVVVDTLVTDAQRPPQQLPAEPLIDPTARQTVEKCVVNGQTTYSSGGACAGTSVVLRVDAARSEVDGGFSQYELQILRSADARIERTRWQPLAGPVAITSTYDRPDCTLLDEQIRSVDAQSRHPLSAYAQDVLRQERIQLTSHRFTLHC